jgi:hypothetical protein
MLSSNRFQQAKGVLRIDANKVQAAIAAPVFERAVLQAMVRPPAEGSLDAFVTESTCVCFPKHLV